MEKRTPTGLVPCDEAVFRLFADYAQGLLDEVLQRGYSCVAARAFIQKIEAFADACAMADPRFYEAFCDLEARYRGLVLEKGALFNQYADVSRVYDSMDAFWEDAQYQEQGDSIFTFWDTYEHGRRRQLEQVLSQTYGSENALLLNSGMSCLAVLMGMLQLKRGNRIIIGHRQYFETREFLTRFIEPMGVVLIPLDYRQRGLLVETVIREQPVLVLLETVSNTPDVVVPADLEAVAAHAPETVIAIDNSVQSHLTRYFDHPAMRHEQVLIFESAVKYITGECMAGVMYGHGRLLEQARFYARATGQQLQEKAFNYLCEAEIRHLPRRLDCQSRNVRAFCEELQAFETSFSYVRHLGSHVPADLAGRFFCHGSGALVFIRLADFDDDPAAFSRSMRRLLYSWKHQLADRGFRLPIRAGFGWRQTACRLYESDRLNQPEAPNYLRISVGIEPEWVIRELARTLGACFPLASDQSELGIRSES